MGPDQEHPERADPHAARHLSPARLAEIAHELRTPLGGIEAMALMIAQRAVSGEERQVTEALLASVSHLRQIASDILDSYRKASHAEAAADETLELRSLLSAIDIAARLRARQKGLTFELLVADGVPERIAFSGVHLRQMIENLLDNALKATETGAVALSVERTGRQGDRHMLRFAVRDSGPGFAQSEAKRIFEPLYQVTPDSSGTGLGLALVRRLAEAAGGEVRAEGRPGEGATIWFTISVAALEARERKSKSQIGEAKPAQLDQDGRRPCILVADDNEASRMVMSVILSQCGCDVLFARHGQEALDILATHAADAILMDMTMEQMDGIATTRAIRQRPGLAKTPIIAVSGRVDAADQARILAAGANGFVAKPFTPRELIAALVDSGVGATSQDAAMRSAAL